ncbi:hypothetical protein [Rothia aerolata]|uniref:Uncharacterized protein n=1 Tax=Rothia aerolata TaxID=1812262 RepID=A0A917IW03_9MICC|nr:hypothetical protein [Rothia aerolata]GGH64743.1 hypothetical protein GCM10007359_17310 [Rothia aerolata]
MGFFTRTFLPNKVRRVINPVGHAKYSARRKFVPKPVRQFQHLTSAFRNPTGYAKRRASYSLSNAIRRRLFK